MNQSGLRLQNKNDSTMSFCLLKYALAHTMGLKSLRLVPFEHSTRGENHTFDAIYDKGDSEPIPNRFHERLSWKDTIQESCYQNHSKNVLMTTYDNRNEYVVCEQPQNNINSNVYLKQEGEIHTGSSPYRLLKRY